MPSRLPVMTRRNKVDRQETHGIRMVMNGETTVKEWLYKDSQGREWVVTETTTVTTLPIVSAQNTDILPEGDGFVQEMTGVIDKFFDNPANASKIPQMIKEAEGCPGAQNIRILPESECPPPLPTSGEVPHRPEASR
jgi:hypothetical protein